MTRTKKGKAKRQTARTLFSLKAMIIRLISDTKMVIEKGLTHPEKSFFMVNSTIAKIMCVIKYKIGIAFKIITIDVDIVSKFKPG